MLLIIGLTLNFTRSYSQIFSSSLPSSYQSVFTKTDAFDSSYLTTLEKVIRKPLPDTLALLIGNDLAYYWHTRDLDKALTYARKFYLQSLTTHDLIWQGRLQTTLGAILLRQDKLDTAMSVLISAQAKLPKKEWPHLLTQMGYVMERRGLLDKAADFAQHALRISDSLQVVRGQAMAYSDLSNLFWKQAKYQKGIEYGLRSETLYNQRGISDLDYSFTLYVIGINYLSSSDYERALAYFNQALVM
ncbi:MAG: tetratricopeptide repeat protein, partial [Cyclobacteriaceae bacterium]|nr:tetratricopeptide repeat protein [Cyclobacteriaceae bacterium]